MADFSCSNHSILVVHGECAVERGVDDGRCWQLIGLCLRWHAPNAEECDFFVSDSHRLLYWPAIPTGCASLTVSTQCVERDSKILKKVARYY